MHQRAIKRKVKIIEKSNPNSQKPITSKQKTKVYNSSPFRHNKLLQRFLRNILNKFLKEKMIFKNHYRWEHIMPDQKTKMRGLTNQEPNLGTSKTSKPYYNLRPIDIQINAI